MNDDTKTLRDYWTPGMIEVFERTNGKGAPRTHRNCLDAFKVARPGKTARDKARALKGGEHG